MRAIPEQNQQFHAGASARAVSSSSARTPPPTSAANLSIWEPIPFPKSLS